MKRTTSQAVGAVAIIVALALSLFLQNGVRSVLSGNGVSIANASVVNGATVTTLPNGLHALRTTITGTSGALSDLPQTPATVTGPDGGNANDNPPVLFPGRSSTLARGVSPTRSAVSSVSRPTGSTPPTSLVFAGMSRGALTCFCRPPDTNGAASRNFYVQSVNVAVEVFDKQGNVLMAPTHINGLFANLGATQPCAVNNDGDPVVIYDHRANRWLISQFTAEHPYMECIAVSTTNDPRGSYHLYQFPLPDFNGNLDMAFQDYPKISVFRDAYYMTTNQFPDNASDFANYGANTYVFNRGQMLEGASAVDALEASFPGEGGLLAADATGTRPPPANEPETIVENWNNNDGTSGTLKAYHLFVDWENLNNSSLTFPSNGPYVRVAAWNWACTDAVTYYNRACFKQPGQTKRSQSLDGIGDRILFRLDYHNFGDHEALLANQVVDVNATLPSTQDTVHGGVRWYEIRDPGNNPYLYQQGTIAPDSANRWMASLAFNKNGDIAAGYSVVDAANGLSPSIRYSTRLATDPLGTFNAEKTLALGAGYQTSASSRWGDYSDMVVDPSNQCSFWYTNELYTGVGAEGTGDPLQATGIWKTRVGKFTIPECSSNRLRSNDSRSVRLTNGQLAAGTVLGTFRDNGPDCNNGDNSGDGCNTDNGSGCGAATTYNALVNFGDRSTPEYATVQQSGKSCSFKLLAPAHTYATPDSHTITVVVQNLSGATTTVSAGTGSGESGNNG